MSRFWESLWAALLREPPKLGQPIQWTIQVQMFQYTVVVTRLTPDLTRVDSQKSLPSGAERMLRSEFMDVALPGRWIVFDQHLNPFSFNWEPIHNV